MSFFFCVKIHVFSLKKDKKEQKSDRTCSHSALHGATDASIAVGGTRVHPGATAGLVQGPQAVASHPGGAGPVEGSVQAVAEVRTPL